MRFRYLSFPLEEPHPFFGSTILKPIIPVEISWGGRSVRYPALVDSGADFCVFDAEIAELLRIPVLSGIKIAFAGIQGTSGATAYLHPVELAVGGHSVAVQVGFSYDIALHGYGVLGQRGFFDLFIIVFDFQNAEIEVEPRSG